jgi:hypothetical protein
MGASGDGNGQNDDWQNQFPLEHTKAPAQARIRRGCSLSAPHHMGFISMQSSRAAAYVGSFALVAHHMALIHPQISQQGNSRHQPSFFLKKRKLLS